MAPCRTIRSLALATLLAGGLSAAETANPPQPAGSTWHPALVYGHAGEQDQLLDLALPAPGAGPAPLVVCIHGGGWVGGNRKQFDGLAKRLATRGFAAASIDYRLAPGAPLPAQIADAKSAVRWLRAHAAEYGIDAQRVATLGESAGGHLALMVGLDRDSTDQPLQAVVSLAGPTDLAPTAWEASSIKAVYHCDLPTAMALLGGPDAAGMATTCSPVACVDAHDPPVLAFHGDADKVVPLAQAQHLAELLQAAGVEHRLVVLPGLGHGFSGPAHSRMEGEAIAFLADHLLTAPAQTQTAPAR